MEEHEHIPAGDPRYDGFRITALWVATGVDPADNQEGTLMGPNGLPLIAADERRKEHLETYLLGLAPQLAQLGYRDVQVKHFRLVE